jgi:hypothetical protein
MLGDKEVMERARRDGIGAQLWSQGLNTQSIGKYRKVLKAYVLYCHQSNSYCFLPGSLLV